MSSSLKAPAGVPNLPRGIREQVATDDTVCTRLLLHVHTEAPDAESRRERADSMPALLHDG